jgi:hypothetical protein
LIAGQTISLKVKRKKKVTSIIYNDTHWLVSLYERSPILRGVENWEDRLYLKSGLVKIWRGNVLVQFKWINSVLYIWIGLDFQNRLNWTDRILYCSKIPKAFVFGPAPTSILQTVRSGLNPDGSQSTGTVLSGPNSKKSNSSHRWPPGAGLPRDGHGPV